MNGLVLLAVGYLAAGTPEAALNFHPSYADPFDEKPGEVVPMKADRFEAPGRFWFYISQPERKVEFTLKRVSVKPGSVIDNTAPQLQLRNELGEHRRRWYEPAAKPSRYEYVAPAPGFYSLDFDPGEGNAVVPVSANVPFAVEVPGGTRNLTEGKGWTVADRPLAEFARVAARVAVDKPLSILWLGDSLTDYDRGSNHVDTVAEYLEKAHPGKVACWNYAKGGDCIRYIIQRMDGKGKGEWLARYADLWDRPYDWAIVFLGHNDTKTDLRTDFKEPYTPRRQQHEMYDELIRRLRAHGVGRIILLSSTSSNYDVCSYWTNHRLERAKAAGKGLSRFGEPAQMEAFNAALREIAARNGVEYLDIYGEMKDLPYKARMVRGTDGVHLTKRGHDYVALKELAYFASTMEKEDVRNVRTTAEVRRRPNEAVKNGAFEIFTDGKPDGWELPMGWTASRGPGRNGGGGLEFSCTEPLKESSEAVQLSQDVVPGKVYDFEAYVSSELEDGAAATVGIQFLDGQGKAVLGAYSGSCPNKQGWRRLSVRTKRLPPDVRTLRIFPRIGAHGCGRVAFDDISLKVVEMNPLTAFVTTAYRDELADEDGFIRLCGGADLADSGERAEDVEAFFTWTTAGGAETRRKAKAFDGTDAVLAVAAKEIPQGTLTLGYELKTKGGRMIGRRERPLSRVAAHAERAVRIDPYGRVIRNGKPFFPIAIYDHTARSNVVALLKDSPFNAYLPYHGHTREMLDWCQANDIAVSVHMGGVRTMPDIADPVAALAQDRQSAEAKLVEAVKNHPAVFTYLDNDEAPIPMLPKLMTRYRMLREADPNHPTWAVLYQVDQIRSYCDTTDAIGSDPYPVPHSSLGWVSVSTRKCRNGTFGALSLWQTSQVFDWAAYKTKGTPDQDVSKYRAPTLAEMKNMNWQMIANGANALLVYSYSPLVKMSWRDPLERRWDEVKESVREIAEQSDVFLSVEEMPTVGPVPESLAVRTWKKGASVFVAVVNASGGSLKTSFGLGSVTGTAKTVYGTGVVVKDGALSVDFAPEGYAFMEFEGK